MHRQYFRIGLSSMEVFLFLNFLSFAKTYIFNGRCTLLDTIVKRRQIALFDKELFQPACHPIRVKTYAGCHVNGVKFFTAE